MKLRIACVVIGFLSLVLSLFAQTADSSPAVAQVPPLIQFSNVATEVNGKLLTGVVGITFYLYKEQQGGSPLWLETQNVQPDKTGHYSVMLGSTTSEGLPTRIFTSGEAHWLGVQVQGQQEQPRVLLVSAPYALKAGDAATIGGLPPSAFVLAPPTNGSRGNGASASNATILMPADPDSLVSPKLLPAGKANYIPVWTGTKTAGNSVMYQANGKSIGVGTTTPAATLDVNGNINAATAYNLGGTAFAFGSYASSNAFIGFAGNPSSKGTYNLASGAYALSSNTTGSLNTASGSYSLFTNTTGQYNTGNGNGTLYSNTDGAQNTASGVAALYFNTLGDQNTANGVYALYANTTGGQNTASGGYALYSNTTGSYNLANGYQALYSNTTGSDNWADGYQALYSNTTGKGNNASGFQALYSNTTANYNTANGTYALEDNTTGYGNTAVGFDTLAYNSTASGNTALGFGALTLNTSGSGNTAEGFAALTNNTIGINNLANGYLALYSNTVGSGNHASGVSALYSNILGGANTASGDFALYSNTSGSENTGVGWDALYANTNGSMLTCIGSGCTAAADGLRNATAIGAHAAVGESNALVLGGTGEYAVKVGIGTTTPSNILTIAQGAGHPVSDGWETFSSRRWKTNIQTLHGSLRKVEQLRGVSYDLKANGKHEVGVIAEEVGAVVPEVVTWDKNGEGAQSVDYSRLTALLIEAVKQQQREIRNLRSELRATRQTLQKVKEQVSAAQPTLLATK